MAKAIGQVLAKRETAATDTPAPLIALSTSAEQLDLSTLPAALDDTQLALVRELATIPPAPLPAATPDHILKCLRTMDAALPRRASDENSGRLMAATYSRMLEGFPAEAISWMAKEALERHDWFPTIKQCKELLRQWTRMDAATMRHHRAQVIYRGENARRRHALIDRLRAGTVEQERIDAMPDWMVEDLRKVGALRWDRELGKFVSVPLDGNKGDDQA